jgi:phosphate transport system substrate-binding protein
MNARSTSIIVAGLVALLNCAAASGQAITGAGSSAAAPIFQTWAREFQKASGYGLTYDPAGSSAGVKKAKGREVDFGASDVAPPEAELAADGLVAFPVAITGIVPVVNLPKPGDAQLRLDGPVLARIFLGEITQWNAPEIARLNPGTAMPDLPIKVVVRSDGSGTTYNFADYLAKVSPAWREKKGVKATIAWPENFIAAKGSDGVVKALKETSGAIAYVDFGYVKERKLSGVQLKNADGEFVRPSSLSFRTALGNSEWSSKGTFTTTLTNNPGKGSWPITMGTFVLVPQVTDKPEQTTRALKFFIWAFTNGDALVGEGNFVRLPDRVQGAAFKVISSVRDKAGNRVAMGMLAGAAPAK